MRWLLLLMSNMGHLCLIFFFGFISVLNLWSVNQVLVVETTVNVLLV